MLWLSINVKNETNSVPDPLVVRLHFLDHQSASWFLSEWRGMAPLVLVSSNKTNWFLFNVDNFIGYYKRCKNDENVKESGDFWWTPVKWRRPFTLGAAILEYNERNFFFG